MAAAGGFTVLLTGIFLTHSGRRNMQKAIDTYNRVEIDEKSIQFTLQPNQLGLRLTFGR
ncbi:MAG: hypothetical protein AAFZ63_03715 [Bacteroidota bacterium]